MTVMAPMDEGELQRMLKTALDHSGPIAFRYPRGCAVGVPLDDEIPPLAIGRAKALTTGADAAILAIGVTVTEALEAQRRLEDEGISVTVVNSRFVKPIDRNLLVSLAQRVPLVVTVEENVIHGGFGSAVLECLSDEGVTGVRVLRLGIGDSFVEHGAQDVLRAKYGIDAAGIARAVSDAIGQRTHGFAQAGAMSSP
jgi:1-deoxy-D-xylulose-5-phosphate synthase